MLISISNIDPNVVELEASKIVLKLLSLTDILTFINLLNKALEQEGCLSVDWIINDFFCQSKNGGGYYRNLISKIRRAIDQSDSKLRIYSQPKSMHNPAKIAFFIECS